MFAEWDLVVARWRVSRGVPACGQVLLQLPVLVAVGAVAEGLKGDH